MSERPIAAAIVVALAVPAAAVPVRVISRSRLDVEVAKQWNDLTVTGTLLDDRDAPIPLGEVSVSVPGWGHRTTLTDAAGRFRVSLDADDLELVELEDGARVAIAVGYGGDAVRGPATQQRTIDLDRDTLQLQVAVVPPRPIVGQAPRVLARLHRGAEPASGLPLVARIGDAEARVHTDAEGRAVFRTFEPLPAGRYAVRVAWAGNKRLNPVSATRELIVVLPTRVTLDRTDDGLDPLRVSVQGRLLGGSEPLAGTVALVLNDTALAHPIAGPDGRFRASLDLTDAATRFGPDRARLRAVYSPVEAWEQGSLSVALPVDVPPPPRVPTPVYVVPLLLLAGLAGLTALGRSGALGRWWRDWTARLRRAFRRRPRPARRAPTAAPPPSLPSTTLLEPASQRALAGVVWDDHLGLPVSGAEVRVTRGDAEVARLASDSHGRFRSRELEDGEYRLTVARPGFVPETLTVRVPHSGRLARYRARITPLRALTGGAWAALVETGGSEFGRETPRELARRLGEALDDPDLAHRAAERFEALYFGGDARVTPDEHEAVVQLLDEVREAMPGEAKPS